MIKKKNTKINQQTKLSDIGVAPSKKKIKERSLKKLKPYIANF